MLHCRFQRMHRSPRAGALDPCVTIGLTTKYIWGSVISPLISSKIIFPVIGRGNPVPDLSAEHGSSDNVSISSARGTRMTAELWRCPNIDTIAWYSLTRVLLDLQTTRYQVLLLLWLGRLWPYIRLSPGNGGKSQVVVDDNFNMQATYIMAFDIYA